MLIALFVISGILIVLGMAFLYYWRAKFIERGMLARSLGMVLLSVELPQAFKKEEWTREKEREFIAIAEQLFSTLTVLKERNLLKRFIMGHPHVAFEIAVHHIGEAIYFYIACPRSIAAVLERHINSFYPTAQVTVSQDYNIFNPKGASVGSWVVLSQPLVVPVPTFRQLEVDPLANVVTAMTKLAREGEGAAVQILVRPASKKWAKIGNKTAALLRKGQKLNVAYASATASQGLSGFLRALFTFFFTMFSLPTRKETEPQVPSQGPQDSSGGVFGQGQKDLSFGEQELVKAIETKAAQNLFETNIRLVASAVTPSRAQEILSQLENAFYQFSHPFRNSFKIQRRQEKRLGRLFYRFSFRIFKDEEYTVLSSEELASLFHFPPPTLLVQQIKWLKAKQAAPPVNLPQEGLLIGANLFRGEEKEVHMLSDDRRRHMYIVGQTGTGKSVLLQEMIRQDMEAGYGVALIDPHGDLAERVLSLVPQERVKDVIYFDPPDIERPIGLNMLEYDSKFPESKTFIVNEMLEIFEKLYNLKALGFGGPIFEQYMRNSLLLIMEDPESGSTLLEVPRVLSDAEFRHFKLSHCANIVIKNFWEKEAEKAGGEAALQNLVPYITSKLNMFIANDIMRPIVAQQKSAFSLREVIDGQKILIVNLAKGRLGDTNSYLLGMILVGRIFLAALSRVNVPEEERRDFYLYIDEFQNVTTKTVASILAESRKYRLAMIMAHQYIAQLEDEIKNAVFGNVGTLATFRVGAQDAKFLVEQFAPVFDENDLVNLDNYNAYLKLLISGQTSKAFNIKTFPPSVGNAEVVKLIKEYSRLTYGRDRNEIEREVYERLSKLPSI